MAEHDDVEDLYGLITGTVSPPPAAPPKRIPLWKLEEMATGKVTRPDGWRGNTGPLLSGWEQSQVHTSSAHDVPPRRKPWLLRAANATGRFILVTTASVMVAALALGGLLFLSGKMDLPALLAKATGQAVAAAAPPARPVPAATVPVQSAPAAPAPAAPAPPPAPVAAAPAAAPAPDAPSGTTRTVTDRPTPGHEEHSAPLGQPAPLTAKSGSYAFMHTRDDGTAVTYDPCRPIHYVTRAANSPAAGPQLIQQAVAAVSRATGLVFVNDGATSEAPSAAHASFQKARYGDRWAPVLIAWETSAEEPRFTNPEYGTTVLGLGGSEAISVGPIPYTYVSGQLELNGPAMTRIIGRDGPDAARAVIEHELGHVVGLGHVNDPTQLMNPSEVPGVSTYAAGDLTGLSILGQGRCAPGL